PRREDDRKSGRVSTVEKPVIPDIGLREDVGPLRQESGKHVRDRPLVEDLAVQQVAPEQEKAELVDREIPRDLVLDRGGGEGEDEQRGPAPDDEPPAANRSPPVRRHGGRRLRSRGTSGGSARLRRGPRHRGFSLVQVRRIHKPGPLQEAEVPGRPGATPRGRGSERYADATGSDPHGVLTDGRQSSLSLMVPSTSGPNWLFVFTTRRTCFGCPLPGFAW